MSKNVFIFLVFLFSTHVFAEECSQKLEKIGRFQIHRFLATSGKCFLTVNDLEYTGRPQLRYRSYLFTDRGLFLVFVSAGAGPEDKMTGARVYYFADSLVPEISTDGTGDLLIKNSPQHTFVFSQQNGFIATVSNLSLKQDLNISLLNEGGVELESPTSWVVDSGWRVGGAPHENSNQPSTIIKSGLPNCSVQNSEIYNYFGTGEVELKWQNSKDFEFNISNLCSPHLP